MLSYFVVVILLQSVRANVPIEGRIVGGTEVDIKKFPYQVSVRVNDKHICGGAIISQNTIITGAHCTDGQDFKLMSVRLGSSYAHLGRKHEVIEIIQHPHYNPYLSVNDVALLRVKPKIIYTNSSRPVKLAKKRLPDGCSALIAGWGVQVEDEISNFGKQKLRSASVRTVNMEVCQMKYQHATINRYVMCAAADGRDSCQGDSGGPLVSKRTREMVGISSYGYGCANKNFPGVYSSVPELLEFIEANL